MAGHYLAIGNIDAGIWHLDVEPAGSYAFVAGDKAGICAGIVPVPFKPAQALPAAGRRSVPFYIAAIADMERGSHDIFSGYSDAGGGEAEHERGVGTGGFDRAGGVADGGDKDI